MAAQQDQHQEPPKKGQDFWKSTRKTFHAASFGAQKYKRLVQKKMDLATNNRKFPALYLELGKMIDDMFTRGETDIMARAEIHDLLSKLRALKETAALLENEIEKIKIENSEQSFEAGTPRQKKIRKG